MLEKINNLRGTIEALTAGKKEEVEALRIKYLSKKGEISALFNEFRNVPNDQKKEIGQRLNELKNLATEKINALRDALNVARPYPFRRSGTAGHSSSAFARTQRDYLHFLPSRLLHCRRSGNRRRLACVLGIEFCRRPPRTRHAGYILHPTQPRCVAAYSHFVRAIARDDRFQAAYPHHLPRTCVPQRIHLCSRTLLLPSD